MRKPRIAPLAVMLFAMTGSGFAAPNLQSAEQSPSATSSVHDTAYIKSGELLMMVNNNGSFAYDRAGHFGKNDGLHYPGHCPLTVLYAAGLWIGAKVDDEVRVSTAEYSFDYTPGTMTGSLPTPDGPQFRVYKIRAGDSRLTNPDYAEWPFDDGAPGLKNHDGVDSVDAEGFRIPLQLGDEAVWTVFNDADFSAHYSDPGSGSTGTLGIESQLYAYAYDSTGELGRIIFMHYTLINKSGNTLDSTHIAFWADPDLGDAGDDLVGCDTTLDIGYCYNADNDDAAFGENPPSVGFGVLTGPTTPSLGDLAWLPRRGEWIVGYRNLEMTAFSKYINGTDPYYYIESWNYMKGRQPDGRAMIDQITGQPTKFMVSGDPLAQTGWLDNNAADRRYMLTSGPFTMQPSDTQDVVVSVMVGSTSSPDCLISLFVDTVHAVHTSGSASGRAFALILDPDSTTGHDYRITFAGFAQNARWSLYDLTLGELRVDGSGDIEGSDQSPTLDGMMVKVFGSRPGIGGWEIPNGVRRFTWAGADAFGFEGFNGAMTWDSPCHFFGNCDEPGVSLGSLRRVLLKLAATDAYGGFDEDDPNASFAYRYLQNAMNPPAWPEFAPFIIDNTEDFSFQSFAKSVPFSAWDVDADPPRRLAIAHLENNVFGGDVDGRFWTHIEGGYDNTSANGPREWIWILDADYSETFDTAFDVNATTTQLPVMYMSTAACIPYSAWQASDEFLIIPVDSNLIFSEADTFNFTAPLPGSAMAGMQGSMTNLTSITDLRHLDSVAHAKFEETHWTCACPCLADPACGGGEQAAIDVFDIVGFIDVAFRGATPVHDRPCPTERTDVNCTGATDIVDVVSAIDVAFRNVDPAQRFCNPCSPPPR